LVGDGVNRTDLHCPDIVEAMSSERAEIDLDRDELDDPVGMLLECLPGDDPFKP